MAAGDDLDGAARRPGAEAGGRGGRRRPAGRRGGTARRRLPGRPRVGRADPGRRCAAGRSASSARTPPAALHPRRLRTGDPGRGGDPPGRAAGRLGRDPRRRPGLRDRRRHDRVRPGRAAGDGGRRRPADGGRRPRQRRRAAAWRLGRRCRTALAAVGRPGRRSTRCSATRRGARRRRPGVRPDRLLAAVGLRRRRWSRRCRGRC